MSTLHSRYPVLSYCRISVVFAAVFLSLVSFLAGNPALAGTVSWVSPVGGNWSDGAKWDGGVVPSEGDDVLITVDGTYTVTLNVDATVTSLTLGGSSGVQTLSANSGRSLIMRLRSFWALNWAHPRSM